MTDTALLENANWLKEGWQDLIAWDDEFYFHSDTSIIGVQSETTIHHDSFLFGQVYSTSPSFDVAATSPFLSRDEGNYFGSFNVYDDTFSSVGHVSESPVLDTRFERIEDSFAGSPKSYETTSDNVFNPYVAGSSHYFSGLDIKASQVFSNVGTWADQPQIIEPITEDDEKQAEPDSILARQPASRSFDPACPSDLHTNEAHSHQSRTRAITIPEVTRRSANHNHSTSNSRRSQRTQSSLSVSPVTHRRPHNSALSRSTSQSRHSQSSLSPHTDSYGWVAYHPNPATNRLAPTSTEGLPGRTPRGRKKALTPEQRTHAALMRVVGACSNCKTRKEKCDPGTPCKSCLEHYKGDLVKNPCRDRLLSDLSSSFLSDRLGWHPTARPLDAFVDPNHFNVSTRITYTIPLSFGFGRFLCVPVHAVEVGGIDTLIHKHIVYSWPPESTFATPHTHAVLPAVLTSDTASNLMQTLDAHLSLLVTHNFRAFPLYCSPLRILREVYVFSRSLNTSSPQSRTLHQALKLLVLVHIGGDITLPARSSSPILAQLIHNTMDLADELNPTPCFIRSQFGAIMPGLALSIMKDVLSSLEQLLLNRDCEDWPVVLAILITVLMTVESIHYHAAKLPYHYRYDASRPMSQENDRRVDDEGVKILLAFYSACFPGCHARLRPDWEGEATTSSQRSGKTGSAEDIFVRGVRGAIRNASGAGYLARKVTEKRQGDDMGFFFDRLVARLLLWKP